MNSSAIMIVGAIFLVLGLLGAPGIGLFKYPLAVTGSTGTYFDHTVIIVMENEGLQDICRQNPPPCMQTVAPYMASLANNYTISQNYLSVYTPLSSGPNYIGLVAGNVPATCSGGGCLGGPGSLFQPNIVDRLESKGLSWKGYFENLPGSSGCFTGSSGLYNSIHDPFYWFNDFYGNSTRCSKLVLANPSSIGSSTCPAGPNGFTVDCQLINDLNNPGAPNWAWLTPNECNNMHGASTCPISIAAGDAYLRNLVPQILGSAAFTTGRGALFITFDEGNGFCPSPLVTANNDCVYAVWSGQQAQKAKSSLTAYNHFSYLKTLEANWGFSSLQNGDASATPMTEYLTTGNPGGPPPLQEVFTYNPIAPVSGSPVTFSAVATGGTAPYSFTWTFGDGSATATGQNPTHTFSAGGTYTVSVTALDSGINQQIATATSGVVVSQFTPALTVSFSSSTTTPTVGQAVTFTSAVTGGIAPYTVSWNFGDGAVDTGATITHSYTATGTYTVLMEVSDSNTPPAAASSSSSVTVQTPPCQGASCLPITASFTWTPTIPETQLQATFTATVTGGTPPYGYSWNFGDGTVSVGNTGNPITHTYGNAGTYTVILTVTDSANGQNSVLNQVTVQKPAGTGGGRGVIGLWLVFTIAGAILIVAPLLVVRRKVRLR